MIFGGAKKNHSLELVITIRGDVVTGTLVSLDTHTSVLYSTQAQLIEDTTSNPETILPAMLKALSYVLDQVTSDGVAHTSTATHGVTIKHITVAFSAPWYTSKVKDIILKKDKPFRLHQKAFNAIVKKQMDAEKNLSSEHTMIEHDVTHVIINGYELKDPFNKKTNEILIAYYASFIATETLQKVKETITNKLHHVSVTYRTFSLMFYTIIRDMFWNIDRFTVFDIGAHVTEISVVEGGAISQIVSIPIGSQQLIKAVQASCSMDPKTIASTIAMLARGDMDHSCQPEVLETLSVVQRKWVAQVQSVLVDDGGVALPQRVFISTDVTVAPVFKKMFTTPETRKNLFGTEQELQAVVLSLDHFRKYITVPEQYTVDTSTASAILFLQATK